MKFCKRFLALILCLTLVFSMTGVSAAAASLGSSGSVESLVAGMSTKQKIAQMMMPQIRNWGSGDNPKGVTSLNKPLRELLEEYDFGGIILFQANIESPEQVKELSEEIQEAASEGGIPSFIALDQEGGWITRLTGGTAMPGNMALGAANNTDITRASARVLGQELAAVGVNVDYAPDADVNNNPANPIIGVRSFGSDPDRVAEQVPAFVDGLHDNNILACLKHFPGHGDTDTDSHTGFPLVNKTYKQLKAMELKPFQAGIDGGADMIMTAHIQYPKIEKTTYTSTSTGEKVYLPATMSKTIITDILRGDMGFDGVVVTDALAMDAVAANFDPLDVAKYVINAGVDLMVMPYPSNLNTKSDIKTFKKYINQIVAMVEDGTISEKKVNAAVTRILTLKQEKGILSQSSLLSSVISRLKQPSLKVVGSDAHRLQEWMIAGSGVTLLKNEDDLLPMRVKRNETLLVLYNENTYDPGEPIGTSVEYAVKLAQQTGRMSSGAKVQLMAYNEKTIKSAKKKIAAADKILILTSMSGTDALDPTKTDTSKFVVKAINYAHKKNKQVALISMHLPYDVALYKDADALLCAYNRMRIYTDDTKKTEDGYVSNVAAAVSIAFGERSPSGTLPVDIPALNSDYSLSGKTLYAVGDGLSY